MNQLMYLFVYTTLLTPAYLPAIFTTTPPKITPTSQTTRTAITPSTKEQTATKRINALIAQTESFITKGSSMPELPIKIKHWIKKDFINLPSSTTWNSFKAELEQFVQKLRKVLDQDAQTKEQKYLTTLIADERVYNNLLNLHDMVANHEPRIKVASFGLDKIDKKTKEALFSTINAYDVAFNRHAVAEGLDKVFEKYEPTAQKIALAEKTAQETAEKESKQKPRTERGVVAGRSLSSGGGGFDSGYRNDYAYNPTGLGSNFWSQPDYSSKNNSLSSADPFKSSDSPSSGGGSPFGGKSNAPLKKPESPKGKDDKPAEKLPTENAKKDSLNQPNRSANKSDNQSKDSIQATIETELKSVGKTVANTPHLHSIKSHVTDTTQPVDKDLMNIVSDIGTKLSEIEPLVTTLAKNTTNTNATLRYKNHLNNVFNGTKLSELANQIDELETGINDKTITISKEKQTAYLNSTDTVIVEKLKDFLPAQQYEQLQKSLSQADPSQKKIVIKLLETLNKDQINSLIQKGGLSALNDEWINKNISQEQLATIMSDSKTDGDTYSLFELRDIIKSLKQSIEKLASTESNQSPKIVRTPTTK